MEGVRKQKDEKEAEIAKVTEEREELIKEALKSVEKVMINVKFVMN